jgi:hypothetical protein
MACAALGADVTRWAALRADGSRWAALRADTRDTVVLIREDFVKRNVA